MSKWSRIVFGLGFAYLFGNSLVSNVDSYLMVFIISLLGLFLGGVIIPEAIEMLSNRIINVLESLKSDKKDLGNYIVINSLISFVVGVIIFKCSEMYIDNSFISISIGYIGYLINWKIFYLVWTTRD